MSPKLESAVERLLSIHPSGFTNKDLSRATGQTKQLTAYNLQRLVRFGYLRKEGRGRGARYVRALPKGWLEANPNEFWEWLMGHTGAVGYVPLGKVASRFEREEDAPMLVESVRIRSYIVLDFAGVESMSERFANELFCELTRTHRFTAVPINASPAIAAMIQQVRTRHREE